ncbi:hypothetical protein HanRHA438_Chr03g0125171 [Helianthus annuus]|nr:hypothetical protein HanIR_Chr03g0123751 [Helianthus annuus]KAJ0935938.1 hypothetical protein HanRHA438_Chr03g0125171 [Helianthus annuus]
MVSVEFGHSLALCHHPLYVGCFCCCICTSCFEWSYNIISFQMHVSHFCIRAKKSVMFNLVMLFFFIIYDIYFQTTNLLIFSRNSQIFRWI